jgi:hypothetical protein
MRFLVGAVAAVGGALMLAVPATADSGGSADSVIGDLKSQGYNVVINWLNGYDTVPLWACTVENVNNPNDGPPSPGTFATVYVDVNCPNHQDE